MYAVDSKGGAIEGHGTMGQGGVTTVDKQATTLLLKVAFPRSTNIPPLSAFWPVAVLPETVQWFSVALLLSTNSAALTLCDGMPAHESEMIKFDFEVVGHIPKGIENTRGVVTVDGDSRRIFRHRTVDPQSKEKELYQNDNG